MNHLAASSVLVFLSFAVATGLLPCSSQLRLLPAFAHLFTHCDCSYSQWSEWTAISSTPVPLSQCESGRALTEERRQTVLSGDCEEKREENVICEPQIIDQLILALGLGRSGHHISPGNIGITPLFISPFIINSTSRFTRSSCDNAHQVCHHVTTPHYRRSVLEEMKRPRISQRRSTAEPEPLPIDPTPFSVLEHGARYRRMENCQPNGMQHILFVLDSSGSVSRTDFERVTAVLSQLVLFFCKPIKVAAMTFDHEYYAEFCFNCYDNTCGGRIAASNAISSIQYDFNRDGVRYTHTGGAAQCVCDFMLNPSCGLDSTANCIDVVFITDGRSNDPSRQVCSDILCLHNRFGVNTYAIGIGNAHLPELKCIVEDNTLGTFHLFNFLSFDDFEDTFQEIVQVLAMGVSDHNGDPYVCIDPQEGVGTEPCVL